MIILKPRWNQDQCHSNALAWDLWLGPSFLNSSLSQFIQNVQLLSWVLEFHTLKLGVSYSWKECVSQLGYAKSHFCLLTRGAPTLNSTPPCPLFLSPFSLPSKLDLIGSIHVLDFLSPIMKRISFLVLVLEDVVGLHRTVQLQLLQHYSLGHRLGLLWCWMICPGNEPRSLHYFWDCTQVLPQTLLLAMGATPFLLRHSCPQY